MLNIKKNREILIYRINRNVFGLFGHGIFEACIDETTRASTFSAHHFGSYFPVENNNLKFDLSRKRKGKMKSTQSCLECLSNIDLESLWTETSFRLEKFPNYSKIDKTFTWRNYLKWSFRWWKKRCRFVQVTLHCSGFA